MRGSRDKSGGSKDKDKKRSKSSLTDEDVALWKAMTRDVRLLPERNYVTGSEDLSENCADREGGFFLKHNYIKKESTVKSRIPSGRDVDLRTSRRLSRGKMVIEGIIDLHGFGQAEAREVLHRFIVTSQKRGWRCVLVITGKGQPGKPGILRTRVPEWLEELGPLVLKTATATANHGGQGALYVLLRRAR
jgi:DNA-nicking Smr family endonuclease